MFMPKIAALRIRAGLTQVRAGAYRKCNNVAFLRSSVIRPAARLLRLPLAALIGAALAGAAQAQPTQYPLTLENCRETVTFAAPPKRVVAIGQTQTEILYALGLGDRIVGTAVWFSPVAKPYEAVNAKVKRLADNDPSFEAVLAQEPDLVTAMFEWHVGPNGIVAKRDQFARVKVPTYVSPTDCVGKDNSGPGDGVRTQMFTMELVYRNIREFGQIFDVADRAEALVAALRAREAKAVEAVARLKAQDIPVVVWFSSKDVKGDGFMAGKNGVPAYILSKLGARNVITTNEEWPLVGWESIAAANPAVIVAVKMDRRRFPADDIDKKLAFLKTDPVASKLDAVKNNRVVIMDVGATRAGLDTVDGIETLARAISGFGLAP
ncbi:Iron complex transport system substrate-binding protein OS=Bosea thiooxidans OX=53254 GN=SAMN05660750_03180 PE=4 SV=1 [Bosea thiooxidans]|uniref:Iron complex transport system substrate-binding protein n=1 Tax=Bosea thiooxidans TaxID=53254 RepID=A0A1T5FE86_9HYPH|nr:iron complex transport system substrate-binding protein [Bosea thiooxidans]